MKNILSFSCPFHGHNCATLNFIAVIFSMKKIFHRSVNTSCLLILEVNRNLTNCCKMTQFCLVLFIILKVFKSGVADCTRGVMKELEPSMPSQLCCTL